MECFHFSSSCEMFNPMYVGQGAKWFSRHFLFLPKKFFVPTFSDELQHISLFLIYQLARSVERICICCNSKSPANPCFRRIQMYSAKQPPSRLEIGLGGRPRSSEDSDISLFYISSNLCCSDLLKNWLHKGLHGNNAFCVEGLEMWALAVLVGSNFRGFPISDTMVGHV